MRPDQKLVVPSYFAHFFRTPVYRKTISALAAGANINNLKNEHLDDLLIPLPPLPEQRRIAAILDQADALRAKRREALAQLDSLTQSIFIEMFGDPVRNTMCWEQKPIVSLGKVVTGNTPPRENAENYGNFIEWIKSDNINTPHYYLTESTERLSQVGERISRTAPPGAILVTCIAGSPDCIGNAAMTNRRVAFNQQINAFIPEIGDPHFYYQQIIVGKKLIQMASTNGMKGMVSKGRFEQINLIAPPVDLQRKFAGVVSTIENQNNLCLASLSEFDALFASLQHRAFRGEL
jgi:type I restriction enzyme S subunit